jgi:hypothetical protein
MELVDALDKEQRRAVEEGLSEEELVGLRSAEKGQSRKG